MFRFINRRLENTFPERRIFVRSDADTRYLRLTPLTQLVSLTGSSVLAAWLVIASAIILMDSIGSGNLRDQATRDLVLYEERLNELSTERDRRALEAAAAQERFNIALAQISDMQENVLVSEERVHELETGIEVVQQKLREALQQRDEAIFEEEKALAALRGDSTSGAMSEFELASTLDFMTETLSNISSERDEIAQRASC